MVIDIYVDKLYKYDRMAEPCFIGIPMKRGVLRDLDKVAVFQGDRVLPLQKKVTARHDDGSVKFLFLRFLADLPANKGAVLKCDTDAQTDEDSNVFEIAVIKEHTGIKVDTGVISFAVDMRVTVFFNMLRQRADAMKSDSLQGLCFAAGKAIPVR